MLKTILIVMVLVTMSSALCPLPRVMDPCVCRSYLGIEQIACENIPGDFDLQGILTNASSITTQMASLLINNTGLTIIEEVVPIQFYLVQLLNNRQLTKVSPEAFSNGRYFTEFYNNEGNEEGSGIFDGMQNLEKIVSTTLKGSSGNPITTIPSHAFQNMTSLEYIILKDNNISSIESRAFAGVPYLYELDLSGNSLPSEGLLAEDAFDGIGSVRVDLKNNGLDFLDQKSWQPLVQQVVMVRLGGEDTFDCDARADWICDNRSEYRRKISGFNCKNGTENANVWDYCSGRNATMHQLF